MRVRVWADDEPSPWSDWHTVEAGLLEPSDWTAQLIGADLDDTPESAVAPYGPPERHTPLPAVMLRREFTIPAAVSAARLYAAAHGVYEVEINGRRAGDHVLAPGWSSYHHRLRYQTYDVTGMLREGENAIGAMVGEGWFRGRLGWGDGVTDVYGTHVGLLAQLEIWLANGDRMEIGTNDQWRAAYGPILSAGLYDGETYDARRERTGWSEPGYDDHDWSRVHALPFDATVLVAPNGPPVRRTEEIAPVAVLTSPSGKTIVDFGQNLVGRVRLRVQGEAGRTVTIRHAEVLDDGELALAPLRSARATDRYILQGGRTEVWEPRFTFHGFRYAEVDGWPGQLGRSDVQGIVCHTDMARTGWFESSDPMLNKLHENVVWSMRGNFLDVPTDCPQRDERLGWTGDIQVFAPTASFLYDCAGMLTSWLRDLAAEQLASPRRMPPLVVPNVLDKLGFEIDAAAWGDAAVIVPWVLYERFGDLQVLRDQFSSMKGWVDGVAAKVGDRGIWDGEWQFGDWLDPTAPSADPAATRTDVGLVATAYLARSADIVARVASLLGVDDTHPRYVALASRTRAAFNAEYVTPTGRLASDSQTAFALAVEFGLLPSAQQRERAGRRLADLVHAGNYRIGTGFVGTALIADALCSVGEVQLAYRLLFERSCPSFLYPVTMGATSMWERWDSMLPDGSINTGEMTSFNHYALGAIADWLHRTVAGLSSAAPGYRRLNIEPRPGGVLTHAAATHETPHGRAWVAWHLNDDLFTLEILVPANCAATVTLPGGQEPFEVASGKHTFHTTYQPVGYPPQPRITSPLLGS